jgi:hypothetical protein
VLSISDMNSTTFKTPLFKSLSDDALREEYAGWRNLAYNNGRMAQQGPGTARKCAASMGRIMRNVELIENIARRRGISLARSVA